MGYVFAIFSILFYAILGKLIWEYTPASPESHLYIASIFFLLYITLFYSLSISPSRSDSSLCSVLDSRRRNISVSFPRLLSISSSPFRLPWNLAIAAWVRLFPVFKVKKTRARIIYTPFQRLLSLSKATSCRFSSSSNPMSSWCVSTTSSTTPMPNSISLTTTWKWKSIDWSFNRELLFATEMIIIQPLFLINCVCFAWCADSGRLALSPPPLFLCLYDNKQIFRHFFSTWFTRGANPGATRGDEADTQPFPGRKKEWRYHFVHPSTAAGPSIEEILPCLSCYLRNRVSYTFSIYFERYWPNLEGWHIVVLLTSPRKAGDLAVPALSRFPAGKGKICWCFEIV